MMLSKIKIAVVVLLTLGILGGAGMLTYPRLGAQQPDQNVKQAAEPEEKKADDAKDESKLGLLTDEQIKERVDALKVSDKLKELLKARVEAAHQEIDGRFKEFLAGRGTLDIFLGASKRGLEAERELSDKKADQLAALEAHLERMKTVQEVNQARFDAGRIAITDLAQSKFNRYQAEIWVERAKAQ